MRIASNLSFPLTPAADHGAVVLSKMKPRRSASRHQPPYADDVGPSMPRRCRSLRAALAFQPGARSWRPAAHRTALGDWRRTAPADLAPRSRPPCRRASGCAGQTLPRASLRLIRRLATRRRMPHGQPHAAVEPGRRTGCHMHCCTHDSIMPVISSECSGRNDHDDHRLRVRGSAARQVGGVSLPQSLKSESVPS